MRTGQRKKLKAMEDRVMGMYSSLPPRHNRGHINDVVDRAVFLADRHTRDDQREPYDMRQLSYYAALLHDIGRTVRHDRHAEAGAELILNDNLFDQLPERSMIAHAVRNHASKTEGPESDLDRIVKDADREQNAEVEICRSFVRMRDNGCEPDEQTAAAVRRELVEKCTNMRTFCPETHTNINRMIRSLNDMSDTQIRDTMAEWRDVLL